MILNFWVDQYPRTIGKIFKYFGHIFGDIACTPDHKMCYAASVLSFIGKTKFGGPRMILKTFRLSVDIEQIWVGPNPHFTSG